MVQYSVDHSILEKTTKCSSNYSCLTLEKYKICSIVNCVDCKVHFVDNSQHNLCSYVLNYGDAVICMCPIRVELHRKYKV